MVRRAGSSASILTVAIAAATLVQLCGMASATERQARTPVHSADEVASLLRQNGLAPLAKARLHGNVYEVDGLDTQGEPTHVVIDAVNGDLIWRTHRGVEDAGAPPADMPERQGRRSGGLIAARGAPMPPLRPRTDALQTDGEDARGSHRGARRQSLASTPALSGSDAADGAAPSMSPHRAMLVRNPLALPGTASPVDRPAATNADTAGHAATLAKARAFVPVAPLE